MRDSQKEYILREAVIELTNRDGFDGLSMHKLAKATNLSASTIYIYFENREDMLKQVYHFVAQHQAEILLREFDPLMSFATGLWVQWRNRYSYIQQHPQYFQFMEYSRHSPLIRQVDLTQNHFIGAMTQFFMRAVENREIPDYEPEVLWSLAFGPLYALVKLGTSEMGISYKPFTLTKSLLEQTCKVVVNSLQNEATTR